MALTIYCIQNINNVAHNMIDVHVLCFAEKKIQRTFSREQREHVGQKTDRTNTYKLLDCWWFKYMYAISITLIIIFCGPHKYNLNTILFTAFSVSDSHSQEPTEYATQLGFSEDSNSQSSEAPPAKKLKTEKIE